MKKNFKQFRLWSLAVIGCALLTSNAWAFPLVKYGVDFRDAAWGPANNQKSYTVDGVTATANWGDRTLYQDGMDGLGIRTGEVDEVDELEKLWIVFEDAIELTGAWITDLFEAPDGSPDFGEWGKVRLHEKNDDGTKGSVLATFEFWGNDADQANGELYVDFGGPIKAGILVFLAENNTHDFNSNEFSVGALTATPEPGTMVLFGLGLIAVATVKRRLSKRE